MNLKSLKISELAGAKLQIWKSISAIKIQLGSRTVQILKHVVYDYLLMQEKNLEQNIIQFFLRLYTFPRLRYSTGIRC